MFIDEIVSQIFRQIQVMLLKEMEKEHFLSYENYRILISSDLLRLIQAAQLLTYQENTISTLYGVIVEEGRNLPEMSFMIAKNIYKVFLEE